MNKLTLLLIVAVLGLMFSPPEVAQAAGCGPGGGVTMLAFPVQAPMVVEYLAIGDAQRIVHVCQGGPGPTVWFTVHNCLCYDDGHSCFYKKTQSDEGPDDQMVASSGCFFDLQGSQTVPSASDCKLQSTHGCS